MFLLAGSIAFELARVSRHVVADNVAVSTMVYAAFWLILFERLGLYRQSFALSMKDELYYTTAALALGAVPQLALFTIVPSVSSSRWVLLLSLLIATVTVGGMRALLHSARNRLAARYPARIAIVGQAKRVEAALESLNFSPTTRVLALEHDDVESTLSHINLTRDADLKDVAWLRRARAWGCDSIFLTEVLQPDVLPHLLEVTARERITLAFVPPRLCAHAYDFSFRTDGHQALIVPRPLRACRPSARLAKRILDVVLGSLMLVLASPIMAWATLAILLESGRPVFFRQERVGLNGKIFQIFKFRSMSVDAEAQTGPVFAKQGDPRVTRLGTFLRRTSIDELPQLYNVLRGEMSLVGPRPERPFFVEDFRRLFARYDERHLVRPGITGWSHVNMARIIDVNGMSERLSHDLFYVENWSIFMDMSVLVKTAFEVLFHKAA
jgi:exopolysaccharide biosynthesis polyprenyl glycosylphosphotransferase